MYATVVAWQERTAFLIQRHDPVGHPRPRPAFVMPNEHRQDAEWCADACSTLPQNACRQHVWPGCAVDLQRTQNVCSIVFGRDLTTNLGLRTIGNVSVIVVLGIDQSVLAGKLVRECVRFLRWIENPCILVL